MNDAVGKAVSKYKTFVFLGYHFDAAKKTLDLRYGFDDSLKFTETFTFEFDLGSYDPHVLDRAIQNLFFIAGVSYYKAYPTQSIRIDQGRMDQAMAKFFTETYEKGLGEYFYVNKLDPRTQVPFMTNSPDKEPLQAQGKGQVIGIGGGKDSLVTAEALRDLPHAYTWSLGHQSQLKPLVKTIGLPHYFVERQIDPMLFELNTQDALNGHIPISAIFACVGTVVAVLSGCRDVVVSNENSSNEVSLHYDHVPINHQYSKSSAFEQNYQKLLQHCFGDSLRYYSFLRPLSEIRIAEIFATKGLFEKYKNVFSSCNRAFIQSSDHMSWCGFCPKCAFTYLALSPFVDSKDLIDIWHKNLLNDPVLVTTYLNLLGISGNKPLDCVGEVKESRQALRLAQEKYPDLDRFEFDMPTDYDYKALAPYDMPDEIYQLLISFLN